MKSTYIGCKKMEMVNVTARWIQLVSYSLKRLSPCLVPTLSSERCVGASCCQNARLCFRQLWILQEWLICNIHSCYTLGVTYPAFITWMKADIISDIYASVKQSKLSWNSVIQLCIRLLCTGILLLWLPHQWYGGGFSSPSGPLRHSSSTL